MQLSKRLIVAGAVVFALGLVLQFPARLAYRWIAPPELALSGISGTLWHGSAAEGMAGSLYLRDVSWNFRPLALVGGKLAIAVSASPASGFLEAELGVTPTGAVVLNDVNGRLPLQMFEDSFQLKGFRGDLNLQFAEVRIRDGLAVRASGSIGLAALSAPGLSAEPLGDFRAEFQSDDSGIVGSVETLAGVVKVVGVIRLGVDRSYSFIGQVATTPRTPERIMNQIRLLGSADERGQREFRVEGSM